MGKHLLELSSGDSCLKTFQLYLVSDLKRTCTKEKIKRTYLPHISYCILEANGDIMKALTHPKWFLAVEHFLVSDTN